MKKQTRKLEPPSSTYLLAVLPPSTIQDEVTAFKQQALERFKTGHALTAPPHITLLPPFRSSRTDFSILHEFAAQQSPIDIQLKGFDRFDQRVIFVDVAPNEYLTSLQKNLELYAHYHLGIEPEYRPFRPHMTVAFKDLKRPAFPEAWAYFAEQPYDRSFTADAICMLKHNGSTWDVVEQWSLSNN
ncbi:2'-5' RNA ligase family protein [Rudanella lutea]|uniref:2'-5' RNA ligase family protein n=1 Tax=Rudanella lutea TaxID=451374 RepID=UPI00039B8E69|nr:2'-5' RNA ligase family protein [Rudanella lutea]